jgi:apolipoprotein N-acyltransferase
VRDERLSPFLLHTLLGALVLYWLFVMVRCGEDECIDRPVVAGITSAFWLAGATVVACTRGRDPSSTAIRWAAATIWVLAAAVCLWFLTGFAFDVVYD